MMQRSKRGCKLPTERCLDRDQVFHPFSHSSGMLLSTYNMPGYVPGAGNTAVNTTDHGADV